MDINNIKKSFSKSFPEITQDAIELQQLFYTYFEDDPSFYKESAISAEQKAELNQHYFQEILNEGYSKDFIISCGKELLESSLKTFPHPLRFRVYIRDRFNQKT